MSHIDDLERCTSVIIRETLAVGSKKDGEGDDQTWKEKGAFYHLGKGINHGTMALLIYMGIKTCDGENHAELALCRFAMACYKLRQC